MRHGILAALMAAVLLGAARTDLRAASDIWMTDVAQALEKAAKEKKDVLMDFTGSDWCSWCIKLDKEVFGLDAFINEAPKHFVFVKLDFPRKTKLPEDLAKQNGEWQRKCGIKGYPTIVLADAKGRPFAKTGYQPGGSEAYVKHLVELRPKRTEIEAALAKGNAATGIEKAKLLDEALGKVEPDFIPGAYKDVIEEIVKADPDNKAGLRDKYAFLLAQAEVQAALQAGDFDGALAKIEAALKLLGTTGEKAQELLYAKSLVFYNRRDLPGAIATLEAALAAAPGSQKALEIADVLPRLKARLKQEEAKKDAEKKK